VRLGSAVRHRNQELGSTFCPWLAKESRFGEAFSVAGRQNRSLPGHPSRKSPAHADSIYALHDCSVSRRSPRRNERRDVAEGVRLRNCSGRRIRAQKYPGGAGSFNLIRVRPQVRLRDAGDATSALSALRCSALGPRRSRCPSSCPSRASPSRRQIEHEVKAPLAARSGDRPAKESPAEAGLFW
jgi:hypothetical protein